MIASSLFGFLSVQKSAKYRWLCDNTRLTPHNNLRFARLTPSRTQTITPKTRRHRRMKRMESPVTNAAVWKAIGTAALVAIVLGETTAYAADVSDAKIAFLMPDEGSTRYEQHDRPGFVAELKKLCTGCTVLYQNADADASKQQQQFNSVISQGAKAIVIDPVDSTAAASLVKQAQSQGVKVIAYDRPIPSVKLDYYVSFNNEAIGKAIAQSLVQHLKATGVSSTDRPPTQPPDSSRRAFTKASPAAASRPSPSTTRRIGIRPKRNSGSAAKFRASARRSLGWSPQTTAPAARPSRP
jgi:hypothetical protein